MRKYGTAETVPSPRGILSEPLSGGLRLEKEKFGEETTGSSPIDGTDMEDLRANMDRLLRAEADQLNANNHTPGASPKAFSSVVGATAASKPLTPSA